MLMTEWYWLLTDHIGLREVRRALNGGKQPEESSEHENHAENTEAGERIGAWMKNLGHTSSRCTTRQLGNRDHPYIPWKDKRDHYACQDILQGSIPSARGVSREKSAVSQRYDLPPI